MKIWNGYCSEHSANIVMIGRFRTAKAARDAESDLSALIARIRDRFDYDQFDEDPFSAFSDQTLLDLLTDFRLHGFSPDDVEQLARDHSVTSQGVQIEVRTQESDINGFMKFMICKHAHIEIYSAHDYPDGPPG